MESALTKYRIAAEELAEAEAEWKSITEFFKQAALSFSSDRDRFMFLTLASQGKGLLLENWPTAEQAKTALENIQKKKLEAAECYSLIEAENQKMVPKRH
jgi:hypothetical protein